MVLSPLNKCNFVCISLGSPDPPTNVVLTLVNHTHILVSWDAPNSDVTAYVVSGANKPSWFVVLTT